MITIDQLLESVDLDFEPRWVTKNLEGCIWIWNTKPKMYYESFWDTETENDAEYYIGNINLSEFDGKDWTECIYEVPRKVEKTGKIEKIEKLKNALLKYIFDNKEYETTTAPSLEEMTDKINELVDAVNELKGAKND